MMISWWSKYVGVILCVLVCDIWINVLLQTSALVGLLHIDHEIMFACSQTYPTDLNQTGYITSLLWTRLISGFGFVLNIIHHEPLPLCLSLRPYRLSFTPIAFSSRYPRPSSRGQLVTLSNHVHTISRSRTFISLHVVIPWYLKRHDVDVDCRTGSLHRGPCIRALCAPHWNSFLPSSPEALRTYRRERPLLAGKETEENLGSSS
jgi:hypothetical protein